MRYEEALKTAERVREELLPHCFRCEIAGSIRRKKPEVKDIEIVAIAKPFQTGLFEAGIAKVVNQWEKVKGNLPCKYTQRLLPEGIKLDLFFADEKNFGSIYLIRTGDWEFSKKFMGSLLPRYGCKQEGGYVTFKGKIVPVSEEEELFTLIQSSFILPEHRNINALR